MPVDCFTPPPFRTWVINFTSLGLLKTKKMQNVLRGKHFYTANKFTLSRCAFCGSENATDGEAARHDVSEQES